MDNSPIYFCNLITDFLFHSRGIALAVFAGGFLLSIWRTARSASYRPIILFLFLTCAILGQSHKLPNLLSFIDQALDASVSGSVKVIDRGRNQAWAQYFPKPFTVHQNVLSIRKSMEEGIKDIPLRNQFERFLKNEYLPSLYMATEAGQVTLQQAWLGHEKISERYSRQGQHDWVSLKQSLKASFDPLPKSDVMQMAGGNEEAMTEALIKSLTKQTLLNQAGIHKSEVLWQLADFVLGFYQFISGLANCVMYALFPFMLLLLLLTSEVKHIIDYFKTFLWLKFWVLGGAFCFYLSLGFQRAPAGDLSLVWERPYFCLAAAISLLFVPVFMLLMTKLGGLYEKRSRISLAASHS
jgi:hypothetical protein